MKKANKKGFTLVELLVTIILLGVIGAIVIYNMSNISTKTKESDYDTFIAKVKSAANVYSDTYPEAFNELYISRAYIYITLGDLVHSGLLDEDEVNPYTKEKIDLSELIKASLDSTNGAVIFTYPLNEEIKEQQLVAIGDYVVYGEPYDCMRGIGSYELALSDEEGNLIDLTGTDENGVKNIDKYKFECKMPSQFKDDSAILNNGNANETRSCGNQACPGLSTTTPGNYEIEYTWITDAGIKKSATRMLRVLAQAIPSVKTNVSDYDFGTTNDPNEKVAVSICKNCDKDNFYQTKLVNKDTNEWDVLTYQPTIEGADAATTSFRIRKRTNNPTPGEYVNVTDGFISNFDYSKQADDGDKTYEITAKVVGHYYKNYTYQATNYARIKTELVVPDVYLKALKVKEGTANDSFWTTDNTYSIDSDTASKQSPVGIVQYEYKLSNDETLDKNIAVTQGNLFNKNEKITTKQLSVYNNGTCPNTQYEYRYIFFRAKNKDGYVGKWTRYDAKLTNNLSRLIEEKSNVPSSVSDKSTYCNSISGECYFTTKQVYVTIKNQKFNVLARYTNDNTLLLTLDTNTGNKVNPLSVRQGYASQQTCDGVFYKYYNYNVANDSIMTEARRWVNQYFSGDNRIMTPAIPNSTSSVVTTYNRSLFNKYKNAVAGNPEYWLLDQGSSPQIVYLDQPHKHGNESTTIYNAYFYYVSNMSVNSQYGGQSSYVKPIVRFKNLYLCSGDGSASNPYNVA